MTDKDWQSLINKTIKAKQKYLDLLEEAEDEYLKRFWSQPFEC